MDGPSCRTWTTLRDGIGLRGYGQRDPKKEYKREGFDLFMMMMRNVKSDVIGGMFHRVKLSDEELQRMAEERRKNVDARQKLMEGQHQEKPGPDQGAQAAAAAQAAQASGAKPVPAAPGAARPSRASGPTRKERRRAAAQGAVLADAPPAQQTVRRERPKLGRNEPCHCGSGKKYKSCHYAEDRAAEAS